MMSWRARLRSVKAAMMKPISKNDDRYFAKCLPVARAKEIRNELLMMFETKNPHVPDAGRETIDRTLKKSGVRYNTLLYPTEHAFTRDEGPRFDPEATDLAFTEMIRLFRTVFLS